MAEMEPILPVPVLIVEDDEYLRHLLYDILKDYILEEASNGKEALMKVRQNQKRLTFLQERI